jgi:hypothetical protein
MEATITAPAEGREREFAVSLSGTDYLVTDGAAVPVTIGSRIRELALFNLAIDSKLRSCDLVKLRVRDVCHGSVVAARVMDMQQKTQRPVQFEITEQTRESLGSG